MGVDVVLVRVTQRGTSPKRRRLSPLAVTIDDGDVPARAFARSGTPMLSRADPYRDLILSPAEMEQFSSEAESLAARADEAGAALIRRVLELARRCRDEPGTELHLQGDYRRTVLRRVRLLPARHVTTVAQVRQPPGGSCRRRLALSQPGSRAEQPRRD